MMPHFALLVLAGLLAGTMNAVAGGGSFVSFPVMVLAGLPPDRRQRNKHCRAVSRHVGEHLGLSG